MSSSLPSLGSIVEARITSLGGLGDGVAEHGGKPLFISKACVGDRLRVRITHHHHEGNTGVIETLLEPGPDRQPAPCPYFERCGGCSLQQMRETEYRMFKTTMLRAAITRAGYNADNAETVFLPPATRRRVEFKTHFPEGQLQLAFYEPRSRTPVSIATCLILHPELEALMLPLQHGLRQLNFQQCIHAVSLTRADSGIDLVLHVSAVTPKPQLVLAPLLESLNLARASLCVNDAPAVVTTQRAPVTMRFGDVDIPLPPDAFLQAASEGQQMLDFFQKNLLPHL